MHFSVLVVYWAYMLNLCKTFIMGVVLYHASNNTKFSHNVVNDSMFEPSVLQVCVVTDTLLRD